jgi:hypothetical protein
VFLFQNVRSPQNVEVGVESKAPVEYRVEKVAALHFLTSDLMKDGLLNDDGINRLHDLVGLVKGAGYLHATIVRSGVGKIDGPDPVSYTGFVAVSQYLRELGVKDVFEKAPISHAEVRLSKNGDATFL